MTSSIYRYCRRKRSHNPFGFIGCLHLKGVAWRKKIGNRLEKSLSSRPCGLNSRLPLNEMGDTGSMWRTPWWAALHLPARNSRAWSQTPCLPQWRVSRRVSVLLIRRTIWFWLDLHAVTSAVASWLLVVALCISSSASSGAFGALELALTSCFDWKLKPIGPGTGLRGVSKSYWKCFLLEFRQHGGVRLWHSNLSGFTCCIEDKKKPSDDQLPSFSFNLFEILNSAERKILVDAYRYHLMSNFIN